MANKLSEKNEVLRMDISQASKNSFSDSEMEFSFGCSSNLFNEITEVDPFMCEEKESMQSLMEKPTVSNEERRCCRLF